MNIIESILQRMGGVSQAQKKFLVILFSTILLVYGKVNFTNLSRYSPLSEKTYRRHFSQKFNFLQFNQYLGEAALNFEQAVIAVIDCSFLKKSGKKTAGRDYFFNSCAGKAERGLEISVISLVEVKTRLAYSLSVQQTPARPPGESGGKITQVQHQKRSKYRGKKLNRVPPKTELTRIDDYSRHLKNTYPFFPKLVRYLVADGYYCRSKFYQVVSELGLNFISKLRGDANLRYLYSGEQKKRGAPRKYDGKVDFNDVSRFTFVQEIESGISVYTAIVWNCCLGCHIRLVYLLDTRQDTPKFALLFSTDIHQEPEEILQYYQARFQIEFIFRDAKQFTGLSDCQSPQKERLDFHFNASLTALNLAKYQAYTRHSSPEPFVFSMASYKRLEFNSHLLSTFIDKLDLDPNLILNHPNFPAVLSYGSLAS